MNPTESKLERRRIGLFLTVLTLLVTATFLHSGCQTSDTDQKTFSGEASPAASPAASPRPTLKDEVDTPIVIKGGSVDLDFKEEDYPATAALPEKHVCMNCRIYLVDVKATPSSTPVPCPLTNPTPTIEINAGGGKKEITIRGTPNSVDMFFDKVEYGEDEDENGRKRKHHNKHNDVDSVTVDTVPCRCPDKKCELTVHVKRSL